MVWVKLDDSFADHPKLAALSDRAFRVHLRALCLCARHLTDGHIPTAWKPQLGTNPKIIAELRDARLWDDAAGGFQIHDYLRYNPSREKTLAGREKRQEAGKAGADARWSDGKSHGKSHGTSHTNRIDNVDAPVPVPSRTPTASQSSAVVAPPPPAEPDPKDRGFRERLALMVLANPRTERDETLYSEISLIATDYTYAEIQHAINETRRSKDAKGEPMKPYPSNWRRFLIADKPPAEEPKGTPVQLWNVKAAGE